MKQNTFIIYLNSSIKWTVITVQPIISRVMWSPADPDAEKSKYHKVGKTRRALLKIRILNVQYCVGTGISAKNDVEY